MGSSKNVDSHMVMCGLPNTTPWSPIIPRTDISLQGNGSDCKTKRGGGGQFVRMTSKGMRDSSPLM